MNITEKDLQNLTEEEFNNLETLVAKVRKQKAYPAAQKLQKELKVLIESYLYLYNLSIEFDVYNSGCAVFTKDNYFTECSINVFVNDEE